MWKIIILSILFLSLGSMLYVSVIEPLNCKDFNSASWKLADEQGRYALACKNLCDVVHGKTTHETLELLGEPDYSRHPGSYWRYSTRGTITFIDQLHIKVENDTVVECFLSAESH